jgi:hypothetical protein
MIDERLIHLLIDDEIFLIPEKYKVPKEDEVIIEFAFFHNSQNQEEIELLDKIIAACKLTPDQFKIIHSLDTSSLNFNKGIVFKEKAPNYYSQSGNVIYSKPLKVLMNSKTDKAELWGILKKLID